MADPKKSPEMDAEAMLAQAVEQRLAALLPGITERIIAQVTAASAPSGDAADVAQEIARQVAAALAAAQGSTGDASGVIGALANQLAELTRRNDGRPYVSPAEQTRRDNARAKLIACLEDLSEKIATGKAEMPVYRLTGQIQDSELGLIDHELWVDRKLVQQKISFLGIPNQAMAPENETAKAISGLFMEWIGGASLIGGAHHHGALQDGQGRLHRMATRNGTIGGRDDSAPLLPERHDNPTTATRAAVDAGITLVGRKPEGLVERVAILGTVAEPAKMQRL